MQEIFSLKAILKNYIQTHTGEKPQVSEVCIRGFLRKDYLNKHLLTYACKKPHVKFVARNFNHLRTYTCLKPYVSEVLSKDSKEKAF